MKIGCKTENRIRISMDKTTESCGNFANLQFDEDRQKKLKCFQHLDFRIFVVKKYSLFF